LATDEFDVALSELEVRLERLRSLYEQYFVGLEKIEPAVARKDVDRRFWEFRKIKVRNTAKRFKLQTLIQRYNTLQQYWMKVCRQIENGTYVRHLARAKRRMGEAGVRTAQRDVERQDQEEALATDDPTPDEVRAAFSDLARASTPPRQGPPSSDPPLRLPKGRSPRSDEPTVAADASPALASLGQKPGALPPPRRHRAAPASPHEGAEREPARERPAAEVTQVAVPRSPAHPPAAARPRTAAEAAPPTSRRGAAAKAAATRPPSDLSDARIDHLYADLGRAQQQAGGEVVSRGALAKSLRQTEARLKAKHVGKQVDFRIDIQDGKPIIKPVVKG